MKLKYNLDKSGRKFYTIKQKEAKDAHYKFIKIKDAKPIFKKESDY